MTTEARANARGFSSSQLLHFRHRMRQEALLNHRARADHDMIRSAFELAGPKEVAGWALFGLSAVVGQGGSAFSDGRCIGAGTIDILREDLASAGLGDGKNGFRFPVDGRDVEPG